MLHLPLARDKHQDAAGRQPLVDLPHLLQSVRCNVMTSRSTEAAQSLAEQTWHALLSHILQQSGEQRLARDARYSTFLKAAPT